MGAEAEGGEMVPLLCWWSAWRTWRWQCRRRGLECWKVLGDGTDWYLASFPHARTTDALCLVEGAGLLRMTPTDEMQGVRLRFVHQLWQQNLTARALVRRVNHDP